MTNNRYKKIIDSKKTIFRTRDLQMIWNESYRNNITYAGRMVDKGLIIKLDKGYYSLNEEYSIYELANSIITPSYVSFNSALFYWGLNFQINNEILSVSSLKYEKEIDKRIYKYFSIKSDLLFDSEGIMLKNNISIASPERAILDSFYFNININIDNWDKINKTYLSILSKKYPISVQNKIKELKL